MRRRPAGAVDRILKAVEALAENPFPQGVEKLAGSEYAYRTGSAIIGWCMKWSALRSWWKSSACDIAKTFIEPEKI